MGRSGALGGRWLNKVRYGGWSGGSWEIFAYGAVSRTTDWLSASAVVRYLALDHRLDSDRTENVYALEGRVLIGKLSVAKKTHRFGCACHEQ